MGKRNSYAEMFAAERDWCWTLMALKLGLLLFAFSVLFPEFSIIQCEGHEALTWNWMDGGLDGQVGNVKICWDTFTAYKIEIGVSIFTF